MADSIELALRGGSLTGESRVVSATIRETISEPTTATVIFTSLEDVDLAGAIRAPATLEVSIAGEAVRHFHLVVVRATFLGVQHPDVRRYAFDLAHELALLGHRADVRMFQEKDTAQILTEVLDGAALPADNRSLSVTRKLTERTYCVQYRETDLNFVSRLLEHEGIFYFAHDAEDHTVVTFGDAQSAFPPVTGESAVPLLEGRQHGAGITRFSLESRATTGRVVLGDYNLENPALDLTASHEVKGAVTERYEYPAGHQTPDEGAALAKIRLEEILATRTLGYGASAHTGFAAGAWFELEGAADPVAGKYLLRSVEHRFALREGAGQASYENTFVCQPHAAAYRPPRRAPRAHVRGVHSAVATGPAGSEIHTDALGRMKGKFFWDRAPAKDDTASCWMRVLQVPIGGSMALARAGWEMAVGYFDGDPDRPIAVARLYNAEKASPYAFPAAASRMSFQTPSTPPGGGKSNEIRMEDSGGGMEFFLNASKDYDAETLNNKTETVAVNEKLEVGVASALTVGADQSVSVGASETTTVTANASVSVTGSRTKSVGASETVSVSGNATNVVEGSDTETTGGSHTSLAALGVSKTSSGSHALTVGGSMISAAGLGCSVAVAGAVSETVGGLKLTASGKTVNESVVGAFANTVGGVLVQAASGNRLATTKGAATITVGGAAALNGAGKVAIAAKKISITVGGVANFLGGGGVLNMTPGSAAFAGIVTLDASGAIKISGNPNLLG